VAQPDLYPVPPVLMVIFRQIGTPLDAQLNNLNQSESASNSIFTPAAALSCP
jgi:hypothetical protein